MWVFHTSISRWSFTEVRVTASLLRSLGLLSVFRPFYFMLWFWWSWFTLPFQTLLGPLPNLWRLFQVHQLQLVLPAPSCSTAFLVLWLGPNTFCFLWLSLWSIGMVKSTIWQLFFFLLIIIIICTLLRVFHTYISWWFLTGVWVTTGLFSIFWSISIMQ